jgi:hypothetical protein
VDGTTSFLVEEFIHAITSQLDRVQDALRLKALNRPLTYALRDISLELKVFVEMDAQGNVRFRSSGANEAGASTVHLGFTTITKPMIDENTISLAATRSTPLDELGLSPEERQRLERLGVRNLAQLNRLQSSTGVQTVARLSDVSLEKLKGALVLGRPRVTDVRPVPPPTTPPPATPPKQTAPPVKPPVPGTRPPIPPRFTGERPPVRKQPASPATPAPRGPAMREPQRPIIAVQPGTRRLQFSGQNLLGEEFAPEVRLNQRPLPIAQADDDGIVVEIPNEVESGALDVSLPNGEVLQFELSVQQDEELQGLEDRWAPEDGNDGERAIDS